MKNCFVKLEETFETQTWVDVETSQRIYFDKVHNVIGFSKKENCNEYKVPEILNIIMQYQKYTGEHFIDFNVEGEKDFRNFKEEL